jgi:capsular polysaccharide export protein
LDIALGAISGYQVIMTSGRTLTDVEGAAGLQMAGLRLAATPTITAKIPYLGVFFPESTLVPFRDPGADAYLVWGAKWPARMATAYARLRGRPVMRIEDGFLRSVGLGKTHTATLSVSVDDPGVYFDATRPSRLEALVNAAGAGDRPEAGEEALRLWRENRLSKYNVDRGGGFPGARPKVILIDQVLGDASIAASGASAQTFGTMLQQAVAAYGKDAVAVRTHPDVLAGKATGYLGAHAFSAGVAILDPDISAEAIFESGAGIWTVSSQFGFEALLRGCNVQCYAMPFYNGWGFVSDTAEGAVAEAARARRTARPELADFFAAALLHYPRYGDPVTKKPLDYFGAVERILDWRKRVPAAGHTVCFNFSSWKRAAAEHFFCGPGATVSLTKQCDAAAVQAHSKDATQLAVWGRPDDSAFLKACADTGLPLNFVEDGFIRSVGLGSDLRTAGSLVIDDVGMYYDATRPSRLERIIEAGDIPQEALQAAAHLRDYLLGQNITKYNLGPAAVELPPEAQGRRVVLVTEQVPGDAAIRLGGGDVADNLSLIRAVRAERPDAFILYKEHPDLVSGNRPGRLDAERLAGLADRVVTGGDMAGLFGLVDELHVISSLAGFEALLRGLPVTVWGRPFYAGWGITDDRMTFPRRTRQASLIEVLAAAYVVYPRYADPVTGVPCSVLDYLEGLVALRQAKPAQEASGAMLQLGRFARWISGRALR